MAVSQRQYDHLVSIASKGGTATRDKYGVWHFRAIGKAGKEVTIQRHGVGYWRGLMERKGYVGPRRDVFQLPLPLTREVPKA